jgi:FtsP/CotA-like multicopper oxidase with cupredoxin domain
MILTDWFDDVWNVTFHQFQHGTFPDLVNSRIAYSPLQLADGTLGSHYPFVSGLINGRGHRYHPNADNCSVLVNTPLSEFVISNEGSFRLRIIVASAWHPFRISIQGHKLRVVATDGEDITTNRTASEVDYVIAQSGERYDVVPVSMEASPSGAYWIVAETVEDDKDIISRSYCLRGHRAYGTLRYGNDTTGNPAAWYDPLDRGCISDSKCYVVNCPFKNYPHSYNLTCINVDQFEAVNPVGMTPNSNMKSAFFNFQSLTVHQVTTNGVNGRIYLTTLVPLLTQRKDIPKSWFCEYPTGMHETRGKQCTHTYTLTSTITEMVLMNLGNAGNSSNSGREQYYIHHDGKRSIHGHPVHLHGYHFRVLKIGYPTYHRGVYMADNTDINCSDAFCEKGHTWNNRPNVTFNPLMPKKDTIIIPTGGYILVRVERNNPGAWFLHCHLAPHQEQGMSIVIADMGNSTLPII